jgi:hypothetical protein
MRKIVKKRVVRYFLELTCRSCGRKETFSLDGKDKTSIPTHGLNDWVLGRGLGKLYRKTELCFNCYNVIRPYTGKKKR